MGGNQQVFLYNKFCVFILMLAKQKASLHKIKQAVKRIYFFLCAHKNIWIFPYTQFIPHYYLVLFAFICRCDDGGGGGV